jgi:TatD DNase family protein
MLIDTHCHLDAAEFNADRMAVVHEAYAAGVAVMVIPAVERANFDTVRELAHAIPGGTYALGIHPLYVSRAGVDDLQALRLAAQAAMADPRFVAIGEIGLDFFVSSIASGQARARQEFFYAAQLALAAEFNLPVLLHGRKSHDILLKYLRLRRDVPGGIVHAFNGSRQQADAFIVQGFALGLGGAMTYPRALQIRRHAAEFSLDHLVLETDAPDIPPAWLYDPPRRNTPAQIRGIAEALAALRGIAAATVIQATANTAVRVLPRLKALVPHNTVCSL